VKRREGASRGQGLGFTIARNAPSLGHKRRNPHSPMGALASACAPTGTFSLAEDSRTSKGGMDQPESRQLRLRLLPGAITHPAGRPFLDRIL